MNLQNDFNKLNSNIQEAFKNWNNKILPHLPQQIEEIAKRTGAMQRKRGISSSVDLLKMLFLYASSNFSFRILAVAACALGISVISDTAWRKHFFQSCAFSAWNIAFPAFFPSSNNGYFCFWGSEKRPPGGCICNTPGWKTAGSAAYPYVLFPEWKQNETGESFR